MRFCTGAAGKHNATALATRPLVPQTGKKFSYTKSMDICYPFLYFPRILWPHYYILSVKASVKTQRLFQAMAWHCCASARCHNSSGQELSHQGSQTALKCTSSPKNHHCRWHSRASPCGDKMLQREGLCVGAVIAGPFPAPSPPWHTQDNDPKHVCPFERQHCSLFS